MSKKTVVLSKVVEFVFVFFCVPTCEGTLSLFLPLLCVCLCVHVWSGEMGHRGGGHLAGTAESGGVQRHLHPARRPRLRAATPGKEGPEGMHTRLLALLGPSVNLYEPSFPKINFLSASSWSSVFLLMFCHLSVCSALLCLASTVWSLLGETRCHPLTQYLLKRGHQQSREGWADYNGPKGQSQALSLVVKLNQLCSGWVNIFKENTDLLKLTDARCLASTRTCSVVLISGMFEWCLPSYSMGVYHCCRGTSVAILFEQKVEKSF